MDQHRPPASAFTLSHAHPATVMLSRLRPKHTPQVPLLPRTLSARASPVGSRLRRPFELEPLAELKHSRNGTQVRFYAQKPPGGGFPSFSLQQQRNKGDALEEFVGLSSVCFMTAGDADKA